MPAIEPDGSIGKGRRAWIEACSALGMAAMAAVSGMQVGAWRRLPEPPGGRFRTRAIVLSREGFPLGVPDGPIALASYASNFAFLAAEGGPAGRRRRRLLWSAKAVAEAAFATWRLFRMLIRHRALCPYCLAGLAASWGVAGAVAPLAWREWRGRAGVAAAPESAEALQR